MTPARIEALDRLDHLVLTVGDVAATCAFYTRLLGMTVVTFGAGRTALRFGRQKINLHAVGKEIDPKAAQPTPGSGDLCLLTRRSPDEWIDHLRAEGVAVLEGPVPRTGALGPITSVYVRDPDGNLIELATPIEPADPVRPLRDWLVEFASCVRAVDFARARALCAPDLIAFGTRAEIVEGIEAVVERQWGPVWPTIREFAVRVDAARGGVRDDQGWIAAPWDSLGVCAEGTTFERRGRLTVVLGNVGDRWVARHTHFSLSPTS